MDLNSINANVNRLLTNIWAIITFLKEFAVDGAKDVSITYVNADGSESVKTFPNISKQLQISSSCHFKATGVHNGNNEHYTELNQNTPLKFTNDVISTPEWDGSTGKYTATKKGIYVMNINLMYQHTSGDFFLFIKKNGSVVSKNNDWQINHDNTAVWVSSNINTIVELDIGDVITFEVQCAGGQFIVHKGSYTDVHGYMIKGENNAS